VQNRMRPAVEGDARLASVLTVVGRVDLRRCVGVAIWGRAESVDGHGRLGLLWCSDCRASFVALVDLHPAHFEKPRGLAGCLPHGACRHVKLPAASYNTVVHALRSQHACTTQQETSSRSIVYFFPLRFPLEDLL
jgi:hypothetical protein